MTCRAATSATTCAGASPTGAQMGYDNEGRLTSWQNTPSSSPTQSATYLSDGAGQRVQQAATSGGATTTASYIGSLEEVTTSGGTTMTTAYYGGLAESVNDALSYLLSDGLGSVSEAVSTAGAVTATQLYGSYGQVRYQSGTLPTSKGYTGQRADTTTSYDAASSLRLLAVISESAPMAMASRLRYQRTRSTRPVTISGWPPRARAWSWVARWGGSATGRRPVSSSSTRKPMPFAVGGRWAEMAQPATCATRPSAISASSAMARTPLRRSARRYPRMGCGRADMPSSA